MVKKINGVALMCLLSLVALGQQDTAKKGIFTRPTVADTSDITIQDAIYNRPFIGIGKSKTAIGGYLEANTNYFAQDGVTEGFSMEMRRLDIFLYSSISSRIKFLAELEFEHGTEEIALETALLDFELNSAINFRGGIILPQIGLFNANHDSPNWEIIERPLSSTQIIPSTLSEVGFGLFGKFFPGNNIVSYDVYVVNGLQENIILNEEGRTFIAAGKSEERFEEDNNGLPMYNARVAFMNRKIGEFGVSYYGGVYNRFRLEGEEIEERRSLTMIAFDFQASVLKATIQGEVVSASIDVPDNIKEIYGESQVGGFIEVIYPFIERKIFGYDKAKINATVRYETVDYNKGGKFDITGGDIGDEIRGFAFGVGFRPTASSVFRVNYRHHWITDVLGNPPALLGGIQFGFASYF